MKKLLLSAASALLFSGVASAANQIYLIGEPQGWDIYSDAMTLEESSSGIYEGAFFIDRGQFMFRFYTELGDWETNSLGIQAADEPVTVVLPQGYYIGHYVSGKGSWNDPYWTGGTLYITVNTNNQSVIFTVSPDIEVPPLMPDMYMMGANLNGVSAWDGSQKFTYDQAKKVYVWEGKTLGSGFKVTDSTSWTGEYNIGSNGSALIPGTPYTYYNGSDSGNITFASDSEVVNNPVVTLDLTAGTILVEGESEVKETTLTLAGTMNDWTANDEDYLFTKNDDGTYSGIFYMFPGSEFQVVLLGSTWYGCEEGQAEVILENGSVTKKLSKGFENNFILTDFEGGNLNFLVDLDAMTLTISDDSNAIDSLEASPATKRVYNLQGVRVNPDKLDKGIYIINGKKVMVK